MTDESQSLMPSRFKPSLTKPLVLATLVACFGSIQYGYHMSELNAPQQVLSCSRTVVPPGVDYPYEHTWLGRNGFDKCVSLDDQQIGLVTSIFSLGGLAGSLYAGNLADKYGRKRVSFFNSTLGILGSLLLFRSNSYGSLLFGRFTAGVSCGSSIVITPLLINEISPHEWKGALGSMNQVSINIGILFTQLLALRWADSFRWRWLLFFGAILALLNFLLLFVIDESPKWLLSRGEVDQAESILHGLRGGHRQHSRDEINEWLTLRGDRSRSQQQTPSQTRDSLRTIKPSHVSPPTYDPLPSANSTISTEQSSEEEMSLWQYITSPKYTKSRRAITAILMGQQFCGINSIIFYGVKVISDLLPDQAILANFGISILNVVVTFGASPLVDHWGRKPLLITSATSMSLASSLISYGILTSNAVLLVVFTFVYIGVFAVGLGPIPFLVIPELSPVEAVGKAQSYGTTCNWLATFIIGYGFPILNSWLGGTVFFLFSSFAILFAVYVYYEIPETKGKKDYYEVWGERPE